MASPTEIGSHSLGPQLFRTLVYTVKAILPDTLNQKKGNKVGDRQMQLARKWHKAGVLSEEGYRSVAGREERK